jgi:CDP-diacylglycerol---serine O-phosphatidyltransferase
MKHIPNLFTLLNLVFGCIAIVYILEPGLILLPLDGEGNILIPPAQLEYIPEKVVLGSLFIGLAAIVDFLDGFVARLFKASSELGKQLDSLADVVSFCVAPSLIVYRFLHLCYAQQGNGLDVSFVWLVPAFIIAVAGAYRLGKFNLDTAQSYSFKGMPTPAVGLLIASFPLLYWFTSNMTVIHLFLYKWFWYGFILLVSYLMVSNLPIMSLKFKDFSLKNNIPKIILIVISIVLILLLKWLAVPAIFILYIAVSLAFKNKEA